MHFALGWVPTTSSAGAPCHRRQAAPYSLVVVLVLGLLLGLFAGSWLIFVRMRGMGVLGVMWMRMNVLMLMCMNQITVAMLVSVLVRVFVSAHGSQPVSTCRFPL